MSDHQPMSDETTEHDELVERVAAAICEAFGDDWEEAPESALGLEPGQAIGKADFREMASEAIAVVRQWDAGK